MSEKHSTLSRPVHWPAPPARGSPSRNRADAMGDDATPPCTGSIPERLRRPELNLREEGLFAIWYPRSSFHLQIPGAIFGITPVNSEFGMVLLLEPRWFAIVSITAWSAAICVKH